MMVGQQHRPFFLQPEPVGSAGLPCSKRIRAHHVFILPSGDQRHWGIGHTALEVRTKPFPRTRERPRGARDGFDMSLEATYSPGPRPGHDSGC